MIKFVRALTDSDRALLALELRNAGIKARLRRFPTQIRVVFDGRWEAVAEVLNRNGYLYADGEGFTRYKFQDSQAFVSYVAI